MSQCRATKIQTTAEKCSLIAKKNCIDRRILVFWSPAVSQSLSIKHYHQAVCHLQTSTDTESTEKQQAQYKFKVFSNQFLPLYALPSTQVHKTQNKRSLSFLSSSGPTSYLTTNLSILCQYIYNGIYLSRRWRWSNWFYWIFTFQPTI